MTKILSLPYNLTDPIDLYVVPFDGQLFIKSDDELDMKRRKEQEVRMKQTNTEERYDYMKRCEYVGYNLKQLPLFQNHGVKYQEVKLKIEIRKSLIITNNIFCD